MRAACVPLPGVGVCAHARAVHRLEPLVRPPRQIDRTPETEPSLAEMTTKALAALNRVLALSLTLNLTLNLTPRNPSKALESPRNPSEPLEP